jgi:hypothetical protein
MPTSPLPIPSQPDYQHRPRLLVLREDETASAYRSRLAAAPGPTPVGAFTILSKEVDPVRDVPTTIQREMAQQGQPVITRNGGLAAQPPRPALDRLSLPGLGIHGTNAPSSIYTFTSHGCIRLHPDDVADLFERVAIGMTGVLIYQPVIVAVIDGRVWIEAHPVNTGGRLTLRLESAPSSAGGNRIPGHWVLVDEPATSAPRPRRRRHDCSLGTTRRPSRGGSSRLTVSDRPARKNCLKVEKSAVKRRGRGKT